MPVRREQARRERARHEYSTAPIVSKVWSFCTTLRDDGVGYGDYLEQLTYLIFLKMADEYAKPPYNRDVGIPAEVQLAEPDGEEGRGTGRATTSNCCANWARSKGMLGPDLHQGPEQDPGPGQALPPHRHDRRDPVGDDGRRRQGRHLRRPAGKERRGHQVRRGPVLHAARPDPRDGRMRPARAGQDHRRSGLRHRRLLPRRL